MERRIIRSILSAAALGGLLLMSGCASEHAVNFKIHTEPEGAHVIYRLDDQSWTYLGVTPLDVVEIVDEDKIEPEQILTLKTMRCGYLEQAREWQVAELLEENEDQGKIFWTPRLIKDSQ